MTIESTTITGASREVPAPFNSRRWEPKRDPYPDVDVTSPDVPQTTAGEHALETPWTIWRYPRITNNKITSMCRQQFAEAHFSTGKPSLSPTEAAANLYEGDLRAVGHFATVESFFQAWGRQPKPSDMGCETNIAVFRNQIKPMWENFITGGQFVLRVRRQVNNQGGRNRRQTQSIDMTRPTTMADREPQVGSFVDRLWENVAIRLVGETFGFPEVVGAVCSMRSKECVISIWASFTPQVVYDQVRAHLQQIMAESQPLPGLAHVPFQYNTFKARLHEQQQEVQAQINQLSLPYQDLLPPFPQRVMATGEQLPFQLPEDSLV